MVDVNLERLEKADEEADKLWKDTYQPEEKEPDGAPAPEPEKVEDTPPEDVAPKEEPPKEEPAKEPDAKAADDDKEKLFEQKYKTLDGKYKVELPRTIAERDQARREAAEIKEEVSKLRNEIAAIQTSKQSDSLDVKLEKLAEDYPSIAEVLKEVKTAHE
jgi:hypothetical protein